jgi:hypothetical protein
MFSYMEPQTLTPYILQVLARHQLNGRRVHLQTVVDELRVRRGDVRRTISTLYQQGHLDLLSLRLTMSGFTIGVSLLESGLPELRCDPSSAAAA